MKKFILIILCLFFCCLGFSLSPELEFLLDYLPEEVGTVGDIVDFMKSINFELETVDVVDDVYSYSFKTKSPTWIDTSYKISVSVGYVFYFLYDDTLLSVNFLLSSPSPFGWLIDELYDCNYVKNDGNFIYFEDETFQDYYITLVFSPTNKNLIIPLYHMTIGFYKKDIE